MTILGQIQRIEINFALNKCLFHIVIIACRGVMNITLRDIWSDGTNIFIMFMLQMLWEMYLDLLKKLEYVHFPQLWLCFISVKSKSIEWIFPYINCDFYGDITIQSHSSFQCNNLVWNVSDQGNTLTHMTEHREMSNLAMWVSDLASAWPFDDDLIHILSRPPGQSHGIL